MLPPPIDGHVPARLTPPPHTHTHTHTHAVPAEATRCQYQCVAILAWLQCVVGVLLPVLVAACTAPPPLPQEEQPPLQQPPLQQQQQQQQEEEGGQQEERATSSAAALVRVKAAAGWARRAAGAAAGGLARLDASLIDCCRRGGLPLLQLQLLAACVLLLANFWLLAQATAHRALLPGTA